MLRQRTIQAPIPVSGVGLHSGVRVRMCLHPAPPDTGIVFRRIDYPTPVEMPASALLVGDTRMCSCLECESPFGHVKVGTIEHIMSALAGLGIDNVYLDIDAAEVPIVDGSAAPFAFLIQSTGIVEQDAPKKFIRLKTTVEVQDGDKWARFEPYDGICYDFTITFHHPAIDRSAQRVVFDFADQSYTREISRARTFGFTQEVEWLRENNLALGGGLDNAIVLDEFRVLNPDGLRYADEFVKHKILDAVGDLYLIGHPLLATFVAYKSGHALNNKLARQLLQQQDAWEWVTFDADNTPERVQRWLEQSQPRPSGEFGYYTPKNSALFA